MSRSNSFDDDDFEVEGSNPDEMDEFDQLRRRSVRTGSAFDELDLEDGDNSRTDSETAVSPTSSSFSMRNFSPGQRLVLVFLVLLDILAVTAGVLIFTGVI